MNLTQMSYALKFVLVFTSVSILVAVLLLYIDDCHKENLKAHIVVNKLGEYAVKAYGQYLHLYTYSGGYIQGVGYGYDSVYQFAEGNERVAFFKTEVEAAIALTRCKQYAEELSIMNSELAADKRKEDSIRALRFDVKPVN